MKKIIKTIFIVGICLAILISFIIKNKETNIELNVESLTKSQAANEQEVYDLILFFGQSNMAGYSSIGIEPRYQLTDNEKGRKSVSEFSAKTGIAEDIIRGSWVTNYTVTDVTPETVYEYHVIDNSLYDLSDLETDGYTAKETEISVNKFNGELVYYDYNTYKFYHRWSMDRPSYIKENSYSLSNANGTNMINEFAKQYHEKTGHKVVCVSAAMGGRSLQQFDPEITYTDEHGTFIKLYAAMANKYLAAMKYMESHNLKIGNKSFVMFQGENETENNNNSFATSYKNYFKRIKSQLNQDLGINKGAIILTGFAPGLYNGKSYAAGVKAMNQTQRELIAEDSDVILGSDFPYKHYVPEEKDYNNTSLYDFKSNMKSVEYATALENAKLVVGNGYDENTIHYTSAALAQIGRETAINMYESMKKSITTVNVTLEKTLYTYDGNEKKPKVTVTDGDTILSEDVDYSVNYSNNTNAGEAKVTITGKGIYSGSKVENFEIEEAQIEAKITGYNGGYDEQYHRINVTVTKPQTGATVKYGTSQENCTQEISPTYKDTGTYTIYYEIAAKNYKTKKGSATIQIEKKNISEAKVTLKQTSYTYDGTEKEPKVEVVDEGRTLSETEDYIVNYSNNINAGKAQVTITGKGNYSGEKEITFDILKAQIEAQITGYNKVYDGENHGITIKVTKPETGAIVKYGTSQETCTQETSPTYKDSGTYTIYYKITAPNYETKTGSTKVQIEKKNISLASATLKKEEYTYDATEKRPEVMVRDGQTQLTKGEHYEVSYLNNTDAGIAKVVITGKGNYSGEKEITFDILKAQIEAEITGYNGLYDNKNHGITIKVTKPETGAIVKYGISQESCIQDSSPTYKDSGTYTVYYKITAPNYETKIGSKTIQIGVKSISEVNVTLTPSSYTYDGTEKRPEVVVKDGQEILTKDEQYTVSYSNNVNAGIAKVIITGKGEYSEKKEVPFEIKKAQIEEEVIGYNGVCDGKGHGISVNVTKPQTGATVKYGISQENCTQETSPTYKDSGTYTIYYKITAPNYETKTGSKTIQIGVKSISEVNVTLTPSSYTYDGTEKEPKVEVVDEGRTLSETEDYIVNYSNNINAGKAQVTITGKGNYSGEKEITFDILKAQIEAEITGYNGVCDGKGHGISVNVTKPQTRTIIRYGTSEGTYDLEASPMYKQPGTYTVYYEITAPNYETKTGNAQIKIEELKENEDEIIEIEVKGYNGTYDGKTHGISIKIIKPETGATIKYGISEKNYDLVESPTYINAGTYTVYYEITATNYQTKLGSSQIIINKKDMSEVTFSLDKAQYIYDGTAKTPEIKVKDGSVTLVKDVDYTVNYEDNVNEGIGKVVVKGKGNYTGIITHDFEIKAEKQVEPEDNNQNDNFNNETNEILDTNSSNSQKNTNNFIDNTISKKIIPNTGIKQKIIIIGIIISAILACIYFRQYKKWNL